MTLKAIAVKDGMSNSAVATADYTINAQGQNTVTAGTLSHVTISRLWDGDELEDITLGNSVNAGTMVYFSLNVEDGYTLQTVTVLDDNDDEVTLTENSGSWSFTMPNSSVTINATATQGSVVTTNPYTAWVATDLANLTSSDVFVIVGNNGSNFAMSNGNGTTSAPNALAVTVAGSKITSEVEDNIKWTVSGNATDGYTFYPNGTTATWLYCTNTNNGVRVGTNASKTFTVEDGYLKHGGTSRFVGIYSSQDWRCYTSHTGTNNNIANQAFAFYKGVMPAISADNVSIAYNAESSSISYTLTNEASDGTMTAATDAAWLTLGTAANSSIALTCSANTGSEARTATVTLTYTYNNGSTVTKDVTVTQAGVPSITVADATVSVNAAEHDGTMAISYENITITDMSDFDVQFYDANNQELSEDPEWIEVFVAQEQDESYVVSYYMVENDGAERTAYCKVFAMGGDDFVYSNLITITQEAAPTATITISSNCTDGTLCYGTYSNDMAFIVPADLDVYEVNAEGGELLKEKYSTGDIVPAHTGVLVAALEGGNYPITLSYAAGTSKLVNDNMLRAAGNSGITASAMAENDPDCLYYRLTMHNGTTIGFWWGAEDGAAFASGANKAYLAVPETQAKNMGFEFGQDGDATEIILNALSEKNDAPAYNMQGQRVADGYKGIVIKNGKKFMVK